MYAWIEGRLEHAQPTQVVLVVGGIGYLLMIPLRVFGSLPALGSTLRLHTSFQVRENHQALYGFATDQEKRCFEALLHVTGIGPKVALSILGHLTPQAFYTALYHKDMSVLCAIPGIGKKSAERLLMEMRDRCEEQMHALAAGVEAEAGIGIGAGAGTGVGTHATSILWDPMTRDARDALIHLGYSSTQAEQAVKAVMKQQTGQLIGQKTGQQTGQLTEQPMTLSLLITRALKEV